MNRFFRSKYPVLALLFLISLSIALPIATIFDSPLEARIVGNENLPPRYENGQRTYLENCAGCHIAIAPGILPSQSWQRILETPGNHYGVSLTNIFSITQKLIWDYLDYTSRPYLEGKPVPTFIEQSEYVKVLHPRVTLPVPLTHTTCVGCHPGVGNYDYVTLTPQWQNAP